MNNRPYILAFGFDLNPQWWIAAALELRFSVIIADILQADVTDVQPSTPKYASMIRQCNNAGIAVGLHCLSHLIGPQTGYASQSDKLFSGQPVVSYSGNLLPSIAALPTLAANMSAFYTANGFTAGIYFDGIEAGCAAAQYGSLGPAADFAEAVLRATGQQPYVQFSTNSTRLNSLRTAWGCLDSAVLSQTTFARHLAEHVAFATGPLNPGLQVDMGWMKFAPGANSAYSADDWRTYFDVVQQLAATFSIDMQYGPAWYQTQTEIREIIKTRGVTMAKIEDLEAALVANEAATIAAVDKIVELKGDNVRLQAAIDKVQANTVKLQEAIG